MVINMGLLLRYVLAFVNVLVGVYSYYKYGIMICCCVGGFLLKHRFRLQGFQFLSLLLEVL